MSPNCRHLVITQRVRSIQRVVPIFTRAQGTNGYFLGTFKPAAREDAGTRTDRTTARGCTTPPQNSPTHSTPLQ